MFITKMSLSRRAVLQGFGATLALPFLEAMVPALTATAKTAANPVRRFGAVFVGLGERPGYWTPTMSGGGLELSTIMKPLESVKDSLTVVSQLCTPIDGHAPTVAAWLTGSLAKKTVAEDVLLGTSIDQVIAKQIGQNTVFPSLEVCTEDFTGYIGGCDAQYACAYMNTISWLTPTTPLPMEINPRAVFERMFGRAGTAEQRLERMQQDRSILDSVRSDVKELERGLGVRDKSRLDEYLGHVREIEQRIQRAERQADESVEIPKAPIGVPDTLEEHTMLLFDLMAVAFETDITRVFTYMLTRDASQRVYPNLGITEPHHAMSHHGKDASKIANLVKLNTWQVSHFGKFLERLSKTPDGDGSVLDHSVLLYGSGMSESDLHLRLDVPTLVAGKGAGLFKGNRLVKAPTETPIGNFMLDLANKFGCEIDRFGLSTGRFEV